MTLSYIKGRKRGKRFFNHEEEEEKKMVPRKRKNFPHSIKGRREIRLIYYLEWKREREGG